MMPSIKHVFLGLLLGAAATAALMACAPTATLNAFAAGGAQSVTEGVTQPLGYTRHDAPRSFLAAALTDELVNPQRNAVGLATRLREAGAPVTLRA